jgi:hypothetical protein
MISDMLTTELSHIADGPPGSDQATLRHEYLAFRKEMLAVDESSNPRSALSKAIASIRRYAPDFEPSYDSDYFV